MALKVLSALDSAKTQYYHFKAIIIAGMGLFTDAYDLFCIPPIMKLLGRIYYIDADQGGKNNFQIPNAVVSTILALPLMGTVIGQLVFGRLGDLIGRRRVYGLALMLMVLSSIACGFSICTTKQCVLGSLGFFRFLLGVGIGGDYPLSATIMSEFANKKTRGAFIAAVFSMQGFGILASSTVTMVVCKIFEATITGDDPDKTTPHQADIAWRLILMLGSIPAAFTYYWRMMMPESARYTALVEQNVMQAAKDMEKVLDVSMNQIAEEYPLPPSPPQYPLISKRFLRRHGRDLFACATTWLLVDIVFYSSNLFQSKIYHRYIYDNDDDHANMNAFEEAFKVARHQAILAICSTIPGYFFTVFFIDRIGRVTIQALGFFFMGTVYLALGIPYSTKWSKHNNFGFMFLYGLTFFFTNFGPNTTTFIVPAELFPARFRSTCHGISGAFGKVGAIIGTVAFLWASQDHNNKKKAVNVTGVTIALLILVGVCFMGFAITYFFTRETMGRSLEENENEDDSNELCFLRRLTKSCLPTNSSPNNKEVAVNAAAAAP